ncbi:RagB/SusD family nutrient uptake outer membrane protein [Mucilaginibacter sp. HMF5004]|uniref:RagB/SusD family nutrient uptake outer membrane protein n=1 Tax=Mucilaginibacter rivuli TaxID=2857527 RepID=UPI001C6020B1|nr:RagB/SusD family nutrient uptake outer membrane protein [Mucilaginibacter rivuli]MBW4889240.1 RagB/SusD family nutrient uptake outer membrane protein [Mucilaginibacter rivuli]
MKKYIIPVLTILMVFGTTSCKKFLKEDLVSTLTQDYYNTDQGLEDLVRSAYTPVRWKFEGEQAYALHNFGTDEFILGDQFNFVYYNTYDPSLNSGEGLLNALWTNNYDGINRCNIGIERIPLYNNGSSKTLGTNAQKTQRLAELRFLRAYYYFYMVQQFGGVPIVLKSSTNVQTDFQRASIAEVYNVIISDLQFAKNNLTATNTELGRATKGAAQHFLAKAYLTRGSAVTEQRGQQPTDIDSAIFYSTAVINSGTYALESDYMNLWNGTYPAGYPNVQTPAVGVNGTAPAGDYSKIQASNNSKEVIFAAQFINNVTADGTTGNRTHEYYICQYDLGIPGLIRNQDNFNGRPFRRLGPSDYTIDIFDRKNDSRFYKSFVTAYYSNVNTSVPKFPTPYPANPALAGQLKYGIGDTAALFIVNNKNTTLTAAQIANYRYTVFARYYLNGATLTSGFNNNKYLTLRKFLDPVRVTTNFNEERGVKNGILARLGETYLIAAEAYGRKGDYTNALIYVNKLRQRAAFHAGEFKNPQTWMFDGGTKGDVTDTYINMIATPTLFTTNAPSENYPASANTDATRFIAFMLNERTRELCGELYRWEDLVRTETLYDRTLLFNKDATSLKTYSKLRPIPVQQINLTTKNGQPLSPTDKQNYQNPGYTN